MSSTPVDTSPATLLFPDAASWTLWLSSHGSTTPSGVWLQISKKGSGIPSVSYDAALDAALCHGWIDGQRRALNAVFFLQRFTPRRRNSTWSKRNVAKVAVLVAAGSMQAAGQAEVDAAVRDGCWERAYAGPATMEVPRDFEDALAGDEAAQDMFAKLGRTARYPFLWRIETAKKPETRRRKIAQFVEMLAEGKTL